MKVRDLLNTSIHFFAAYKFRGAHDDDMSGYWSKRRNIPDDLVNARLFGWEIVRDRLCMAVDDSTLEKVLYTIDGGDGSQNKPKSAE